MIRFGVCHFISGGEIFSARCSFNKVTENAQRVGWLSQRSFKAAALDYFFTTPILAGVPEFRCGGDLFRTRDRRGPGAMATFWCSHFPPNLPLSLSFLSYSSDTELCHFQLGMALYITAGIRCVFYVITGPKHFTSVITVM